MELNLFDLNDNIYLNNNNILLGIINDLNQLINYSQDHRIIKILGEVINKMNYIINENKKNIELLRNDISLFNKQMNKRFDELKINNNQELKLELGKYVGQVINGVAEGRGILYGNNGNIYVSEFKNNKNEGKGVFYQKDGSRYEGDFKYGHKEGQVIKYFNNGDRRMGDYFKGEPIGKHVTLTKNGEVKIKDY